MHLTYASSALSTKSERNCGRPGSVVVVVVGRILPWWIASEKSPRPGTPVSGKAE